MTDNGQLTWEDPPQAKGSKGRWFRLLEPVMERPGQWARVLVQPGRRHLGSVVTELRGGKYLIPPGKWEFTSRRMESRETALYARYLGPQDADS
jgi:hypothetical protein